MARTAPRDGAPARPDKASAPAVGTVRVPAGRWLVRGTDGRLTAFAFTAEGVLRWTEERPGGSDWAGPDFFPVAGLDHLTVSQGANGYAHLVGRRVQKKKDGSEAVDIVHAVQYQTGRTLGAFRAAGTPYPKNPERRLGAPAVGVDDGGFVHVVVLNPYGGLNLRREDKTGKWEAWKDIKGRKLYDPPAMVATSTGTVEIFAAGGQPAYHWVREKPHGAFDRRPDIPLSVRPGSLTGLETSPGRVTWYWTDPERGTIVAHRTGGWLIPIGGAPDDGQPAVLRAEVDGRDCTVLAHRDAAGGVLTTAYPCEDEQSGVWWAPTGLTGTGAPALAVDGTGRVVVGVFGGDGRLRLARQAPGNGLAMGPVLTV
ncbi:hypothetical protein CAC01_05700 [Streptomyces sp. CLI2509]|nr:hypothetical protein [Streptomyces sp. SID8380]ASY32267.1 hypothetical protein CAC01_05700 [Streptomyces sp. CLI2509]MYX20366.1 hypothetical protein [Streptomyces sp. SID8380]